MYFEKKKNANGKPVISWWISCGCIFWALVFCVMVAIVAYYLIV